MVIIFWPWLVVIGLCLFASGFCLACLLASAGMASRDRERIEGRRVPVVKVKI